MAKYREKLLAILTDFWSGRPSTLGETQHNRAGPGRVVMVEVIVDPAPDLSAGGEEGEVGYAPMQNTTQTSTQTTFYPLPPTSLALPLTSFPCAINMWPRAFL